jgi:hypothetical protein
MTEQAMTIKLAPETKELVLRTGEALPTKAAKSIVLSGTLGAPFQFFSGKDLEEKECHLLIKNVSGVLELHVQDINPYTEHVITGTLLQNADLKKFLINTEHRWTIQDFLKFVKQMRYFFADKSAHARMILSLQKWSVKVERIINEHNDGKGNTNFQLQTKVDQSAMGEDGVITKFDLLIPIFQGYDKVQFTVEIGLDPNNATVKIFLLSDQLVELEQTLKEKFINDELAKFAEFNCSKVVIS